MSKKLYDFTCDQCGTTRERLVEYEHRQLSSPCDCGGKLKYRFPFQAALGYMPFDAYYDPALGVDINGRRQKQQELKARGLVEAGDASGGARNFDEKAPYHLKPLPPKGITRQVPVQKQEFLVGADHAVKEKSEMPDWSPQRPRHRAKPLEEV